MSIDKVAVSREKLKQAAEGGSLSNEAKFRDEIARIQGNIAEYRPSVVEISSSAERQYEADLVNLEALKLETNNKETARLAGILQRAMKFLARTKENN